MRLAPQTLDTMIFRVGHSKVTRNKGNIVRSNRPQVDQCVCPFLEEHLEKNQSVSFKNLILTVNLHVDHVFSGYVCVP